MKRIILRSLCFVLLVSLISSLAATVALAASEQGSILNGVKVGFYGDSICAAGRENRIGWAGRIGDKNQMICNCGGQILELVNKKPIMATDEELNENPPSRSAKLRIARKIK